ncbi:MAG: glycosyltransferase family 4 protein [Bacteroidota bacterium]
MQATSPKKVLLLTDWYLPGFRAGGPIRSCANLVNALKNDCEFFVLTREFDLGEKKPYANIQSDIWVTTEPNVHIYYASQKQLRLDKLAKLLASVAFDTVYLNSMYSLYFTIFPLLIFKGRAYKDKKVVLAPRGMLAKGAMSVKSKKKEFFIRFFKFSGIQRKIIFQATDQQELLDIQRIFGLDTAVITLNNFPGSGAQYRSIIKKTGILKLICVSRVSPEKNILGLIAFLAQVRLTGGEEIQMDVYGALPPTAYVEQCKDTIQFVPSNIRVSFKGELNHESLLETLIQYHFFILPTLGENFGHAIFEAMSAGRPVIISDRTPWKDLETKKVGWDIPLDKPEAFVEIIQQCCQMGQAEYNSLSIAAWEFAKGYHSSVNLKDNYIDLFSKEV